MRDLVLWPGIKPGPLALGVWSLSHWTTKEVPHFLMLNQLYIPRIKSYWLLRKIIILSIMKVKAKSLSHVRLFVTPWTIAYQAPPSMESSRQEYWSGWPFPSPGDLPDPGIKPGSPTLQADALQSRTSFLMWFFFLTYSFHPLFLSSINLSNLVHTFGLKTSHVNSWCAHLQTFLQVSTISFSLSHTHTPLPI